MAKARPTLAIASASMQYKVPHIWINDSGVDLHTATSSRHRAPHPCRRWALNSVHQSSAHLLNQASLLFGRLFSDVLLQDGVEGSSQGAQQHGRRAVRHSRSGHAPHKNAQHETARYQGKSATAESQGWSWKYWGSSLQQQRRSTRDRSANREHTSPAT